MVAVIQAQQVDPAVPQNNARELIALLKDKLKSAGVSSIEIERPGNKLRIIIRTARPGIIIGRKGAEIDKLKGEIANFKVPKRVFFVDQLPRNAMGKVQKAVGDVEQALGKAGRRTR